MCKRIALFNHKGGVSKTTTTFNIGWKLAELGKRVIIVDADPQCNLTGMVLGYKGPNEFETFYQNYPDVNIKSALAPAFESQPNLIEAVDCVPVEGRENLFLLPGHLDFSEYEVTLGISQELSGSIQTLKQLPGAITYLLEKTAKTFKADYVIIDMNPSLSSINQNLLMTSDFFLIPTSPDYFSVMAIESLAKVLPKWTNWAKQLSSKPAISSATYPFPVPCLKFLGTVIQKYRPRSGGPSSAFQKWIDSIQEVVAKKFAPTMSSLDLLLPAWKYDRVGIDSAFTLSTIPDFNSLIAISQKSKTPIFALKEEQMGYSGVVLERTLKSRNYFNDVFSDLAEKIIGLITADE